MEPKMIMSRKTPAVINGSKERINNSISSLAAAAVNQKELSQLLYSSFKNSLDDRGEELTDWEKEVEEVFSAKYGELLKEHSFVYKLEDSDRYAATVVATQFRKVPLLIYVAAAPEVKGKGLAAELLEYALQSFADSSYKKVFLVVTLNNLPALKLYKRVGFTKAGDDWETVLEKERSEGNL